MDSKRNIQILNVRKKTKQALKDDFENAILYYHQNGADLQTALSYLDIKKLGGFYARPPVLWVPLDDAAKIYPPFRVKYYKNRTELINAVFESSDLEYVNGNLNAVSEYISEKQKKLVYGKNGG